MKSSDLSPGELVDGKYRVVRALGEGSFGSTYLVEGAQPSERFVLKISNASPGIDPTAIKRFAREAEVRRRFTHRNVASLIEYSQLADGRPYLVTEWIDGVSVREFLKERGPLPLLGALEAAEAVTQGLAAAHNVGIIHRDIKPENVILPVDAGAVHFDNAKLVDFGVHGVLLRGSNATLAGQVFGTPNYMSPEQLRGEPQTPAADIYGLGMLLYEMLYGRPAFTANNIGTFILKVLQEKVSFPSTPQIPAAVTAFIDRCLSKSESRPQSAIEVIAELRTLKNNARLAPVKAEKPAPAVVPPEAELPSPAPAASDETLTQVFPPPHEAAKRPPDEVTKILSPAPVPVASIPWAAQPYMLAPAAILFAIAAGLSIWAIKGRHIPAESRGLIVGVVLILGGIALGSFLQKWLGHRRIQIESDTEQILQGAKTRVSLTDSIALEVDALFRRCKQVDERIFAASMALMLKEYESAKESDNRQAALMNVVQITDKLRDRLCPWYVKHARFVSIAGSAVGVISGAASATESFLKILGKHP